MLQNRTSQEFRKNLEKLRLHLSIEEKRSRKKKNQQDGSTITFLLKNTKLSLHP